MRRRSVSHESASQDPAGPNLLSRRKFLKISLAAAAVGLTSGMYTWQVEPHWLEVVYRPPPIRDLPKDLEGARLVQLSDLHVGGRVADDYVLDVFHRIAKLKADIVAITGDFTSFNADINDHAKRIYSKMPRGRLGTVGILGNHDYGHGWSDYAAADWLAATFRSLGIKILRNEVTDIAGLQIIGMDDLQAKRFLPQQAFSDLDMDRAMLALSHNPDTVDLAGWEGFKGWILAGHTHGGQCKPPFLPPPLLPVENRRYTSGEFTLSGGRQMYISRGIGHLLQVRFNVRPEVTVFELGRA